MTLEELAELCREAARDLAGREPRPLPAAVVLPGPEVTQVVTLPDLPDDDDARAAALEAFAQDHMRPDGVPCYGFLAEAELAGAGDVVVVAYGARNQHPRVTAAALGGGDLGPFLADEPLAPGALPFLAPLQAAADAAEPPDVTRLR